MSMMGDMFMLLLNILVVWLLIDAYKRPPFGFHGPPWFVLGSYAVMFMAIVMVFINVMILGFNILRSSDG